ncbi:hypothetical protein BCR32DRAFT_327152 [Anaeromyces robustus]|uniref:P-loop containing nucleoside triphosphate hydrolase protein n=1 Tax=Anaeromyces robustus TaxID=1754192 RepID=A0A1Y1X7V6_9FUNG|nr:hypothetical protein BCR32DRAFT_327152 [Anaeromyces robustus]|eukprot:ORX81840.1 hypothetical protein BCR32DRAFT_327152 [Anaeromyces robustus]
MGETKMEFDDKYLEHTKKYDKVGIPRLLEMANEKKILLLFSTILSVIAGILALVPYISVYKILEVLLVNYGYYSNNSRKKDEMSKDSEIMIKWSIIAIVSYGLVVFIQYGSLMFSHVAAFEILYKIRISISEHIGFLPLGYLSDNTIGAISKTLEQNVEKIELFIAHSIPDLVKVATVVIFTILVFMRYNVLLTIFCIFAFMVAIICQFGVMFSKASQIVQNQYYDITEVIGGSIVQFIHGIPVVKIFGKTVFSFRKLADDLEKYREISLKICDCYRIGMCLFMAILESFATFVIPIGLLLLARSGYDMAMALDYIFFIIMSPGLASPLYNLLMMSANLTTIAEGNRRIDKILNEDIISQPEHPKIPTKFNVTFKNVTFNYKNSENEEEKEQQNKNKDGKEEKEEEKKGKNDNDKKSFNPKSKTTENILDNISFEAENGKITALVGPSGSGKSTIGSLIPRFWDIEDNNGEICIGGINIKDIKYKDLMNIISFVFQDTFLFNDTVYENIVIGKPNATKQEVIAAAKAAQCHEFIESLPHQYDTIIGSSDTNDGVLLSGGEQQRICIARAILKNSPILVLDEATAYSDPENEYNIQLALKELIKNKTVLVIAHNLNTIKSADNIIVVNKGKIEEQGKHDELLANNGLYCKMWNAYISTTRWFISNKTGNENGNDTNSNDNTEDIHFEIDETEESKAEFENFKESMEKRILKNKTETRGKKIIEKEGMLADNLNILYNVTYGHPKRMYVAIVSTMIANLVNILPFILTIKVVQTIFDAYDGSNTPLNTKKIWIIFGMLVGLILVMFIAQLPAYDHCYTDAYNASAEGRMELAEHIRRLPLGTIYSKDPGELVNILMNDFLTIENASSHMIPQLFGSLVVPIIAFCGLVFIEWRLAIASFAPFVLGSFVLFSATSIENILSEKHMAAKIETGNRFKEYLSGIRCIKAYNLIGDKFDRLEKSFQNLKKESIKIEAIIGPFVCLTAAITHSGLALMVMVGAHLLQMNEISISTFVIFLVIGNRVYDPLIIALMDIAEVRYSALAGKRIGEFLDLPIMEGTKDVHYEEQKDIIFKDVNFKYMDQKRSTTTTTTTTSSDSHKNKVNDDKYTLKDINLTMKQGSMTALVGPSGSGKTTILKLISKFYDVNSGKITFAGEDISKIDPEFYMKNISIVFQDVYLFKDTIANNIRFSKDDATKEEIIDAAKKACAHDFIMSLPNGYNTMVGEGGCTLSGGEKQRISIARAILKDSPIVLLDEATSSLDPENEVDVQRAISELIQGRTVIVISHHLKTIMQADNIVVLENGSIVEQGQHDDLINQNGVYKRLWDIQEKYKGWTM